MSARIFRLLASPLMLVVMALSPQPAAAQAPGKKTVTLSPQQLETIRLREIAMAARRYTNIAFSPANQRKLQATLPLSEANFQVAIALARVQFQACMEGGFEARLKNALDAQVLRKAIESTQSADMNEPEAAKTVIPAFVATDAYCAKRIKVWMAGAIE
jgi:predicted HicB family RNase H-like nuclease